MHIYKVLLYVTMLCHIYDFFPDTMHGFASNFVDILHHA